MQALTVSAGAFQYSLAPNDQYGAYSQYDLVVSVIDASGNQVEQLGQGNFSCFIHLVEHGNPLGLQPVAISRFEAFGKGMYGLVVIPKGLQGIEPTPPKLVAVIVEQFEIEQEGPKHVEIEIIARGQVVVVAAHGQGYLP